MFEAVAIGVSAGGMQALKTLLGALPPSFRLPIAVVQHIEARSDAYLCDYLNRLSAIEVKEAEDKEPMRSGVAYLAPAGYHLLVEPGRSFSLSVDEKVNFCRPSIDLLFESAADAFGKHLIGVVLTGANADGAMGLKRIKERGGFAVVQNPETAEAPYMPRAAITATSVDEVADLDLIAPILVELGERTTHGSDTEQSCV
jgi:two-component system chemotaxis response regulator CheB